MSDAVAEIVAGLMAWQVHAATGCDTGAAVAYVRQVMYGDYGSVAPTAETTVQIIAEVVELAGGESGVQ